MTQSHARSPAPRTSPAARTSPAPRTRRHSAPAVLAGVAGIAVVALLVAGCAASSGSGSGAGSESGAGSGSAPEPGGSPTSAAADSAVGEWGHDAPGLPHLELVDDGSVTGTDGCNRLFGSWTQDEQTVEFSGVGSTRMACPDVDTWLERMHSARVDGDALHISDADGAQIGTLDRAD